MMLRARGRDDPAPELAAAVKAYAACVAACALVLYPVLLVVKKAIEPGTQFLLSPSPVPSALTLDHFRGVLGARGSHGEPCSCTTPSTRWWWRPRPRWSG
ncbi:MAG: hypothetical protein R2939_12660 [Kofleriaceae bacterium]